jgi:hypothetical protein
MPMKSSLSFSLLLSVFALCGTVAQANNILIYKVAETVSGTSYIVENPGSGTQKGYAPQNYSYVETSYIIVDLDGAGTPGNGVPGIYHQIDYATTTIAQPAFDKLGADIVAKKLMAVSSPTAPGDFGDLITVYQPIKPSGSYLWNQSTGEGSGSKDDRNGDSTDDLSIWQFIMSNFTGVGTPLVLSPTLTIPNVARTASGKAIFAGYEVDALGLPGEYGPSNIFDTAKSSKTWKLDTALTKAANTQSVAATVDLQPAGTLAAGTLLNGVQRVHDLLYAQGFRILN